MSETIQIDYDDATAYVHLHRPEALNAVNPDMARALRLALEGVQRNVKIRCVVLCGSGGHFSLGGDVQFLHDVRGGNRSLVQRVGDDINAAIRLIRGMPKPVLACINGAAAGFGVSLVAACDLALATDTSVFTLGYARIGLTPDGGASYFLPRLLGMKRATELLLLGELFDAHQAMRIGLINRVVPTTEVQQQVRGLAHQLAEGPQSAIACTKQLLNESLQNTLEAQLERERACLIEALGNAEAHEGTQAYLERRAPRFG